MADDKTTKQSTPEPAAKPTRIFTFPVHGIAIEASSLEEAEAKLATQLQENTNA